MSQQHHILYVPGLGDDAFKLQTILAASWRLYGVHGHCHSMPWAGEDDYDAKFARLLQHIDDLSSGNNTVSLIGASAGASAVLNAYVARPHNVVSLAYICAKINFPETVGEAIYRRNPSFRRSMARVQISLQQLIPADKQKMTSFFSPSDGTVSYADTVVPGVPERTLPALLHPAAIFYSLSFGFRAVLARLREG